MYKMSARENSTALALGPQKIMVKRRSRRVPSWTRAIARLGAETLSDVELLAAIDNRAWPDGQGLAGRLISETQSLWGLSRLGFAELRGLGVRPKAAARLLACLELGRRAQTRPPHASPIREPADVFPWIAPHLQHLNRERFVTVVLDSKNRPCHVVRVGEGSVGCCPVDPREIFGVALRERSSAIVVAHNHPSGDATPSSADIKLTVQLAHVGELLRVPLMDHLIVANDRFVSLASLGLIPLPKKG